ncbi:hypothetical protein CVT25_007913 [Psilocybe cyanescens]|uniref:Reverse transcriptase domain-containing protein n=1 Tax=Psilocybe cyanescens TaxID=93625 RepID=A0A409XTS2_PSICY|nr:hypothetical protein CVT25_007913 [Psilocybe cyanescens]
MPKLIEPVTPEHASMLMGSVILSAICAVREVRAVQPDQTLTEQVTRVHNAMGKSDHIPLATTLSISADSGATPRRALKADREEQICFVRVIKGEFAMKVDKHPPLNTPDQIDAVAQAIADLFSAAWETCSREITITRRSKLWWTDECSVALQAYQEHGLPEDWKLYRKTVKNTKRVFFDSRITEISITNKRTWDLMLWVQQHKLPLCKAIQYQGQPCHALPQLWDTLHNTYNSASDRMFNISILDSIPDMPVWGWVPFSALEMREAKASCSNVSASGPDHIKWSHLKMLMCGPTHVFTVLLVLANASLWVGHWPKHFKESMSVIILKLNKPSYSAPKAFRPIVLLNTVGKLIEKMLANCIQFDGVASDVFHPNQIGGIRQQSTEDAGLILMHMVHAGWAKGLKTSVIAFDVTQFFLSLNHEVLMAIFRKLGFSDNVVKFFSHYLVGRSTQYAWGDFISDLRQADVGVGQGSALSPVLSALYLTLIMRLFELDPLTCGCFLLSYVDDGTLVVQLKSLLDNCEALKQAYSVIFKLFKKFGLALEHDSTIPLKPKLYWQYLGFYFDHKLTFTEHVQYYSTKALSTVKAMKMLGSSTQVTYGFRLWYFAAACCKGALHHFSVMQCSAALWITGAFCTSPTGGMEALAGLPPSIFFFVIYLRTDASLPLSGRCQAIVASILFSSGVERWRAQHVAGKVTTPNVELYAIRSAIVNVTLRDDCTDIFIFTDLMASACRAVDPSIHSRQGHSVAVCEALQTWFTRKDGQSITFVYVPSRLQWDLHYKAHKYATELKVALGPRSATSFDSLRMQAALSHSASWNVLFQDPEY